MRNEYEVRGDVTVVKLIHLGRPGLTTQIDTADLPKLLTLPATWFAQWEPKMNSFYVRTKVKGDGKRVLVVLSRFLLDAPTGMEVDHINHDILDNRRSNLRLVTFSENRLNCSGPRRNGKSGELGVCWHAKGGKWRAYIHRDKRQVHLGYFDSREDAVTAARNARAEITDMVRRAQAAGLPVTVYGPRRSWGEP